MLIPLDWLRDEGYAIGMDETVLNDLEIRLFMRAEEDWHLQTYGCLDFEKDAQAIS